MKTLKNFKKLLVSCLIKDPVEIQTMIKTYARQFGYSYRFFGTYSVCQTEDAKNSPLVCSHYDTVRKDAPPFVRITGDKIESPDNGCLGGDDRCGVAIMLSLMQHNIPVTFAFFDKEECGMDGSSDFIREQKSIITNSNCYIGLDRRGRYDAATYSYKSEKLLAMVGNFGYEEAMGSCTDVSNIESSYPKPTVNLSVGFYREHTEKETIQISEAYETYKNCVTLLPQLCGVYFSDLQSDSYGFGSSFSRYTSYYDRSSRFRRPWYEDDDDDYYFPRHKTINEEEEDDDAYESYLIRQKIVDSYGIEGIRQSCLGCRSFDSENVLCSEDFECLVSEIGY